jgi:hypothetical protein
MHLSHLFESKCAVSSSPAHIQQFFFFDAVFKISKSCLLADATQGLSAHNISFHLSVPRKQKVAKSFQSVDRLCKFSPQNAVFVRLCSDFEADFRSCL